MIIKRYTKGHKLGGYTNSGSDGSFRIKAEAGDSLLFSMLGFKSQHVAVTNNMKPLTIRMSDGAIELKEVAVKSDKVHEHGDTISYIVGAYANGNDRSIGDVIAKMPGFDVDKSTGKISYEGKPISKFYIEGLDMLGASTARPPTRCRRARWAPCRSCATISPSVYLKTSRLPTMPP